MLHRQKWHASNVCRPQQEQQNIIKITRLQGAAPAWHEGLQCCCIVESGGIAAVVALGAGVAVATDSISSDQRSFGCKGQHQEEITPELRQMADSIIRSGGAFAAVRVTTFGEIKHSKSKQPSTATQPMATAFWQGACATAIAVHQVTH